MSLYKSVVENGCSHPGKHLKVYLLSLGISQTQLAKELRVPESRVNNIIHEKIRISADTACRLSRYLGTSFEYWMNLQIKYDVYIARKKLNETSELDKITPYRNKKSK